MTFYHRRVNYRLAAHYLTILSLSVLWGCSTAQKISLAPQIPLLPPQSLGQHWQLTQSVILYIDANGVDASSAKNHGSGEAIPGAPLSLLVAWSISERGLDVVGLTPSGQTLMTLGYDGEQFFEDYSPQLPTALPGRQILAQLQLSYWPLDVINQRLKPSPWRLITSKDTRDLYLGKRKILNIHITPPDKVTGTGEIIEITNTILHSRLIIKTLERTILP
ncbi:MAG: DUF3261 domain-containing protein [Porticoccaceae bacterium]|nr:DUF3261 domain-containing protein [Porticoccaceae bacterium]